MNKIWLLVQEVEQAAEAAAEHSPNVFSWNMGVTFWTWIIFALLMVVLVKWAFPPILGYAQAREDRIQQSLDDARAAREEAQQALESQRRELAEARTTSQEIIAKGKQDAEKVRQELLESARTEQQEVVERAKREIERERERALESIRREAVELSIAAASHLMGRRLDADEDRRLVNDFLARASDGGAPAGAGAAGGRVGGSAPAGGAAAREGGSPGPGAA